MNTINKFEKNNDDFAQIDYMFKKRDGKIPNNPKTYYAPKGSHNSFKNIAKHPKLSKRMFIAGLLAAGSLALALNFNNLTNNEPEIPAENENISNTELNLNDNFKNSFNVLAGKYVTLSNSSKGEDLDSFAHNLSNLYLSYVKNQVANGYDQNVSTSDIEIRRQLTSKDSLDYAYVADINGDRIFLKGDIIQHCVDTTIELQEFNSSKDNFSKLDKLSKSAFETIGKDYVISYNKENKTITTYEIDLDKSENSKTDNDFER